MLESDLQRIIEKGKSVIVVFNNRPLRWSITAMLCLAAVAKTLPLLTAEAPYDITVKPEPVSRPIPVFTAKLYREEVIGGLVYGPKVVITECFDADLFSIYSNDSKQGEGFYTSSGGLQNKGRSAVETKTYLNVNKADGLYEGTETVMCFRSGIDGNRLLSETKAGYSLELVSSPK